MKQQPEFSDIREADRRIQRYIHRTPILTNQTINKRLAANLFFKCENFQKSGSFKYRGVCNAIDTLTKEELKNGVITHSSGNHGQALARAAAKRDIPATVVMPENSAQIKIDAVREYGAEIEFCEPFQEARETTAKKIQNKTGAHFIPSYNDARIISGQGTLGYELMKEIGDLDYILVPVGGGGLISGVSTVIKYLSPETRVVGCEPDRADDARDSFYSGERMEAKQTDTIADGLRTSLGSLTFPIIQKNVDDIVTVTEESIKNAMRFIWERMKIVAEPSSAVPLAALFEQKLSIENHRCLIIVTGGNVDLEKLPW